MKMSRSLGHPSTPRFASTCIADLHCIVGLDGWAAPWSSSCHCRVERQSAGHCGSSALIEARRACESENSLEDDESARFDAQVKRQLGSSNLTMMAILQFGVAILVHDDNDSGHNGTAPGKTPISTGLGHDIFSHFLSSIFSSSSFWSEMSFGLCMVKEDWNQYNARLLTSLSSFPTSAI